MSKEISDVKEIRVRVLQIANVPTWPLDRVLNTAEAYFKFVMQTPITDTKPETLTAESKKDSKPEKAPRGNSDILS